MKSKILFSVFVLFWACNTATAVVSDDTTKIIDSGNRRIIVTDNVDKKRVEVEVYELREDGEADAYEKIFEGHYQDGKVIEQRRSLLSIDMSSPLSKINAKQSHDSGSGIKIVGFYDKSNLKHIDPHYSGFGVGFAGFADRGDIDEIPLRSSSSIEINFNMIQKAIPLSHHYKWALVTGFGIRWTRYHLKGNHFFEEIDDYTQLLTASGELKFKKSKLGVTTLNVPLLLEWQKHNRSLFVSAGAVCSFKTASSSRIFYVDENGKKQKEKVDAGMTLRPVTMDILVQVGTKDFGIFSRYSPISLFEKHKGPELYPLTFGAMLYF